MKLSIIIPTVRRGELLEQTLVHVMEAIHEMNAEIILVNDSRDSVPELRAEFSGIKLIDNRGQGAAAARNAGAAAASGDVFLFIDDDILVEKKHLEHALHLNEQFPGAAFNFNWKYPRSFVEETEKTQFGRFIIHARMVDYKGWVPELNWSDTIFDAPKLAAFFLFIPAAVFKRAGGFNTAFKRQSVEDDEFSIRLREMGTRLFIDPTVFVLHNERDKMELKKRLDRLKTGAFNKRQASDMGIKGYEIRYSLFKRIFYSVSSALMPLQLLCTRMIPNARIFDIFYRRSVHVLIGTVIFQGYYRKDNSHLK